jgi:predicted dehydrogenase
MILASLTFDDGLVLNLEASWAQHIPEDHQYLEIYGNKGGLQVDPELKLSSIDNSFLSNSGYSIEQEGAVLQNMFDKEIAHYRDCILGETECRSSSETGLNLMRIIDAIYQSAEEGCEVLLS